MGRFVSGLIAGFVLAILLGALRPGLPRHAGPVPRPVASAPALDAGGSVVLPGAAGYVVGVDLERSRRRKRR